MGEGTGGASLPLPGKLGQPTHRAPANAGYTHLEQLAGVAEAEIARFHGIGPNALAKLRQALTDHGLSFAAAPGERRAAAGARDV